MSYLSSCHSGVLLRIKYLIRQVVASRRSSSVSGLAILILAVGLSACQSSGGTEAGPAATAPEPTPDATPDAGDGSPLVALDVLGIPLDGKTKVGLLLPLSGPQAQVGQAMLRAAELALFDIAGEDFTLIVRDTAGQTEAARAAARSVLEQGVNLILGPLFSSSVGAVAEEAALFNVPIITFSNNLAVAAPSVFVMGIAPQIQVERVVDFASRRGLQFYATLVPSTAYGSRVVQAMRETVEQNGAELKRVGFYDPSATDVSEEVKVLANYDQRNKELLEERALLEESDDEASKLALERLEDKETLGPPDFEALLLAEGGNQLLTLAPLLAFYDVDPAEVQFLGTSLWNDPSLGNEPTLQGGWFAAPAPELWQGFASRYQETFQEGPPRVVSLAYDAVALAAILARLAENNEEVARYDVETLTNPNGFSGIDGIFRFLPDGRVERALAVLEMRRNGFRTLEAAPTTFQPLIN
ncbi:MAG: penicillin-binding protein activator [Pseudomonadota bacterium]